MITYSKTAHLTVLAERPDGLDHKLSPKMDHLVCFMPGTIALGATGGLTIAEVKKAGQWGQKQENEVNLAIELTKTCWGMYKVMATGLAPEIAFFDADSPPHMEADGKLMSEELTDEDDADWRSDYIIKPQDSHNLQRPETVESLFYMWRITEDDKYREWGWEMFKSFVKYSAADDGAGFTSLDNANEIPPMLKDNMESFWLVSQFIHFLCYAALDDIQRIFLTFPRPYPNPPSKKTYTFSYLLLPPHHPPLPPPTNHPLPGRNPQILLPPLLAPLSPPTRHYRYKHRSTHFPSLSPNPRAENGLDAQTERCRGEDCKGCGESERRRCGEG